MEFLLMMLDATTVRSWNEQQKQSAFARMRQFMEPLTKAGICKDAIALGPDFDGARIRVNGGYTTVIEGPFEGAQDVVGGLMVLECESREQAIEIAKKCPAGEWTTLEVRPIWRP
jgi:hypothetical protein